MYTHPHLALKMCLESNLLLLSLGIGYHKGETTLYVLLKALSAPKTTPAQNYRGHIHAKQGFRLRTYIVWYEYCLPLPLCILGLCLLCHCPAIQNTANRCWNLSSNPIYPLSLHLCLCCRQIETIGGNPVQIRYQHNCLGYQQRRMV